MQFVAQEGAAVGQGFRCTPSLPMMPAPVQKTSSMFGILVLPQDSHPFSLPKCNVSA
jgi:hypothetical protein